MPVSITANRSQFAAAPSAEMTIPVCAYFQANRSLPCEFDTILEQMANGMLQMKLVSHNGFGHRGIDIEDQSDGFAVERFPGLDLERFEHRTEREFGLVQPGISGRPRGIFED
jgi:hypothetical protein